MKILCVNTGGTIGSALGERGLDLCGAAASGLAARLEAACAGLRIEVVSPINILSENLCPRRFGEIYGAIRARETADCDGIIITHGTDTLAYTSAAMSFLLAGEGLPVVLVAADYPPEDPRSNAAENLTNAAAFIKNAGLPGVFSIFRNKRGDSVVYLGTRLLQADGVTDEYSSYLGADFGLMTNGEFSPFLEPHSPGPRELLETRRIFPIESIDFKNAVMRISPYPGLDYSLISLDKKRPAAVLHELYHSATACDESGDFSAVAFAEKCRKLGVDFYILAHRPRDGSGYPSTRRLLGAGAVSLHGISAEAALAKLNIAYNQTVAAPHNYMRANIFFEYC